MVCQGKRTDRERADSSWLVADRNGNNSGNKRIYRAFNSQYTRRDIGILFMSWQVCAGLWGIHIIIYSKRKKSGPPIGEPDFILILQQPAAILPSPCLLPFLSAISQELSA
jgi:hypothetical protein